MPIILNESESLSIPEKVEPAVQANTAWIETVVIRAPFGGVWTATIESHPFDGAKIYRRNADGEDTVIQVQSSSLQEDMGKDPSLVDDVNAAMSAIIKVSAKIKALRDAEKEKAEAERLAQQNNN